MRLDSGTIFCPLMSGAEAAALQALARRLDGPRTLMPSFIVDPKQKKFADQHCRLKCNKTAQSPLSQECAETCETNKQTHAENQAARNVGSTPCQCSKAREFAAGVLDAQGRDGAGSHHGQGEAEAETNYQSDTEGDFFELQAE